MIWWYDKECRAIWAGNYANVDPEDIPDDCEMICENISEENAKIIIDKVCANNSDVSVSIIPE